MTTTDNAPTLTRTPVLEARKLVKTFGRVVGLDGVSLQLFPGEVLAIIGDNGAGKSTLIKCLTGAEIPDEGELFLDGQPIHFRRPQDARAAGIGADDASAAIMSLTRSSASSSASICAASSTRCPERASFSRSSA